MTESVDFEKVWPNGREAKIREGRLLRKIEKLKKQRDYWKKQHDYYAEVISMQPYLERRHKSFTEMKQEIQRVKDLETRVKEQAKLIELLGKQNDTKH